MAKTSILIIEDNDDIRFLIKGGLEKDGYDVRQAAQGKEALQHLAGGFEPQAILLDLMLPDQNGLDLIAGLRKYSDAPVIVVTAKSNLIERVVGFEVGADDYVVKPFQMQELLARVKAHVRRYTSKQTNPSVENKKVKFRDWIMDPARFQIFNTDGSSANLTAKEYQLLEVLVSAPNKVFTREQLLDKSRANNLNVTDRAIDTQIARIRKKLKDDGEGQNMIQPLRGIGYYFAETVEVLSD